MFGMGKVTFQLFSDLIFFSQNWGGGLIYYPRIPDKIATVSSLSIP